MANEISCYKIFQKKMAEATAECSGIAKHEGETFTAMMLAGAALLRLSYRKIPRKNIEGRKGYIEVCNKQLSLTNLRVIDWRILNKDDVDDGYDMEKDEEENKEVLNAEAGTGKNEIDNDNGHQLKIV